MCAARSQEKFETLLEELPPECDRIRAGLEKLLRRHSQLTHRLEKISRISDHYQAQLKAANGELNEANDKLSRVLAEVKTLRGFIPICARCKRIRDDHGYWNQLEAYLTRHSDATFTHGVCPACAKVLYPEIFKKKRAGADEPPREKGRRESDSEEIEVARRLDELHAKEAYRDHPLMKEIDLIGQRHLRQLRRVEKITHISDGFQRQLKDLNSALDRASRTDPLTGLSNRRDMMERLKAELVRTARRHQPLAVLMADADRFKNINDTFGHDAGDMMLKSIAEAIRAELRGYDSCARWGGEEFLVLAPETDLEGAIQVAERVCARVAQGVVEMDGQTISTTLSIGVAVWNEDENITALLSRSDAALYEAKRLGRNRVHAAR